MRFCLGSGTGFRRGSLLAAFVAFGAALSATEISQPGVPAGVVYKTEHVTGAVVRYVAFPSAEVRAREVLVWLPPSYETAPERRYPVVYMHDGQCLFDPSVSLSHAEWGIDESMTRLVAAGEVQEAIIVGVGNTPLRFAEYVPKKAILRILGSGSPSERVLLEQAALQKFSLKPQELYADAYLRFLVGELKPFMDKAYRTLPDRANTSVAGSSMGGLISLYAISEYPGVFGQAACISTHWPVGDGMTLDYLAEKGLPEPAVHRLYFDFGTATLDSTYEPYQLRMDALMRRAGYVEGENWVTRKFPGAEHSERAWQARAPEYLKFLLQVRRSGERSCEAKANTVEQKITKQSK